MKERRQFEDVTLIPGPPWENEATINRLNTLILLVHTTKCTQMLRYITYCWKWACKVAMVVKVTTYATTQLSRLSEGGSEMPILFPAVVCTKQLIRSLNIMSYTSWKYSYVQSLLVCVFLWSCNCWLSLYVIITFIFIPVIPSQPLPCVCTQHLNVIYQTLSQNICIIKTLICIIKTLICIMWSSISMCRIYPINEKK